MPNNTLFNYFSKRSGQSNQLKTCNSTQSSVQHKSDQPEKELIDPKLAENGDIVWVNTKNQEWVLALVWNHLKTDCSNKDPLVSVYFFSGVKEKNSFASSKISLFQESDSNENRKYCSSNANFSNQIKIAKSLLKVARGDRMKRLEDIFFNHVPGGNDDEDQENQINALKETKKDKPARKSRQDLPVKKYRKIIYSDSSDSENASDSDADYSPEKQGDGRVARIESSEDDKDSLPDEDEKPVAAGKKRKHNGIAKPSKPNMAPVKTKLLSFQATSNNSSSQPDSTSYLHETLDFLRPERIQDANGNRPGTPNYDKCTLKVPLDFLKKQTPAMHQWWSIKSKHYDVILCFKVGKFYELYHMDAVVGVKELGLIYMKGNFAHSGFPEVAFGRYSSALVEKGFSVARVEQTETPEQNSRRIRQRSLPKHEKTLRREVCRITTKGTQTYNAWANGVSRNHENNFLLAITGRPLYGASEQLGTDAHLEIGVCFVDTSVGVFHLNQFKDDRSCSKFRTLISHYYPCQVLFERGKLPSELGKILHTGLASVIQNGLSSGTQFWDAGKCLKTLLKEKYFAKNDEIAWPPVLNEMKSESDSLGLTSKAEYELALSCLGACVFYLKKCLVDFEVLSMGQFELYRCDDDESLRPKVDSFPLLNQRLILDSVTLTNLEIIENSKGSREGSLLEKLDLCKTPFGRRLLRQWICSPPCHPDVINARLDAIDDFRSNHNVMASLSETLTKMPDLERMLAQIHSLSKGSKSPDHPDSRAVLYEEKQYSKRKINDFMSVLEHYQVVHKCLKGMQNCIPDLKSSLLRKILCLETNEEVKGEFPDMEKTLLQWKKAFDHKQAKETGKIIPNPGTNPEYDLAVQDIKLVVEKSESYLKEQKKMFCCSQIAFKGSGNKRFQIEIPVDRVSKRIPDEYEISGQRKGFRSFRTEYTLELVKEIEEAESRRDAAQADSMAIVFREFSKDYQMWNLAVQLLAQLDVLVCFTLFSKGSDGIMCRPEVLLPQSSPTMIDIRDGRHPCVTKTLYSDSFIPNDTLLGCVAHDADEPDESTKNTCLLLTGPNMGGKSTLMRQVGLLVILAQMGSYVPARFCKFTACDRIFTRLGAFDRIMSGESTFFVELGETSTILKHATSNSLVLLDELGRGTSTYDGTAIASAVLKHVSESIQCRTVFSTHYRTLVDDASSLSNIQLGHMACMVEDGDDPCDEVLTFLYKLASGACPKSYGFHAALLAGVEDSIVKVAHAKAAELERAKTDTALFKKLFNEDLRHFDSLTSCSA